MTYMRQISPYSMTCTTRKILIHCVASVPSFEQGYRSTNVLRSRPFHIWQAHLKFQKSAKSVEKFMQSSHTKCDIISCMLDA